MTVKCQYCGEKFESEQSRGVHVAEKHVEHENNIPKPKKDKTRRKENIIEKWSEPEQ